MERHDQRIVRYIRDALVLLSEHYRNRITEFCVECLSGDRALAEEIAQQTFLEFPKYLVNSNVSPETDAYFLKVRDHEDLLKILQIIAVELCLPRNPQWDFKQDSEETRAREALSEPDRILLFLIDNGLKGPDLVKIYRIAPGTLRQRVFRAKQRLERLLEASSNA